ncbi:MAG: hypothetical protein AAGJ11_09960 [Bacteroidota bacterium]
MPAPDFDEILGQITDGIAALALATVRRYADDAVADATAFLDRTQDKLERWTGLLAAGDLTTEDVEWLVRSQASLLEMRALKQSGLALVRVDEFRASVLNLVTDTIFGAVL